MREGGKKSGGGVCVISSIHLIIIIYNALTEIRAPLCQIQQAYSSRQLLQFSF